MIWLVRSFFTVCVVLVIVGSKAFCGELHQHNSRDIGNSPAPQIELSVYRDQVSGVNVHISVKNYWLNAPNFIQSFDAAEFDGNELKEEDEKKTENLQGHAHVFVNGIKRQRLYGSDIHISNGWLKKGVNQITISLNSHQHENWTVNDKPIVDSILINLEQKGLVLPNHKPRPVNIGHDHH
ncbi:MAG: hypothetical protein KUG78_16025 [Kangiellaceae bacterium]|nr:hypothetical protein [Kangiellaceae bacterium]